MKAWFLGGKRECPVFIEPDQWARLCEYWSKPETEQKALRMANARKAVKNKSTVGRAGKAGKEALLVSVMLKLRVHEFSFSHFRLWLVEVAMTEKFSHERPHVYDSRRREHRGVPGLPR